MILLSFDIEEFDLPIESGVEISFADSISISRIGTIRILDILKEEKIKATFFCTTVFAENAPDIITRIIDEGHELASHGCSHTNPQVADIPQSKKILETLTKGRIYGYRQPRMAAIPDDVIANSGYMYNSSLHPAWIPGRYMHLSTPRMPFVKSKVLQIPTSVTPFLRLPVFWLACHNYPFGLYKLLCRWIYRHDKLFVIYFHPWEFVDLTKHPEWKISYIIRHNSGKNMCKRLAKLIEMFKANNATFGTFTEYTHSFYGTKGEDK